MNDLVGAWLRDRPAIERGGVLGLVLDAIGDLRDAAIDPSRLRAILHDLIHFCAANDITVLLNGELSLAGEQRAEDIGIPTTVDNILVLRNDAEPSQPTLTVLKARRTAHARDAWPISIDRGGFHVAPEGGFTRPSQRVAGR